MSEGHVEVYIGESRRIGYNAQQPMRVNVCEKYERIWKSVICIIIMCILLVAIPVPTILHLKKADISCSNHIATEETVGVITACLYFGFSVEFKDINSGKLVNCIVVANIPICANGTSVLFYAPKDTSDSLTCSLNRQTDSCNGAVTFGVIYYVLVGSSTIIIGLAYLADINK